MLKIYEYFNSVEDKELIEYIYTNLAKDERKLFIKLLHYAPQGISSKKFSQIERCSYSKVKRLKRKILLLLKQMQ